MRSRPRSQPKDCLCLSATRVAALFFAFLVSSNLAQAQYRFDTWTTEHGLPQNSVLTITRTRDGDLWPATYNGLVRFDGVRFTSFDAGAEAGWKPDD